MTIKCFSIFAAIVPLALLVGTAHVRHASKPDKAVTRTVFLGTNSKPLTAADVSTRHNGLRRVDENAKRTILAYLEELDRESAHSAKHQR